MRASLVPIQGGSPIEIVRDVTVLGRKSSCDVQLDHRSVSKLHLVIVRTDGLLLVRDLGSTNGTSVNGQPICRGALLPDDELSVGACKFRVDIAGDAPLGESGAQAGVGDEAAAPWRRVIRVGEPEAQSPESAAAAGQEPARETEPDSGDPHANEP